MHVQELALPSVRSCDTTLASTKYGNDWAAKLAERVQTKFFVKRTTASFYILCFQTFMKFHTSADVIYCMIVYVKLSRQVCNIVNCKYCLYNVLLLSRVHPYPVDMIELSVVE